MELQLVFPYLPHRVLVEAVGQNHGVGIQFRPLVDFLRKVEVLGFGLGKVRKIVRHYYS